MSYYKYLGALNGRIFLISDSNSLRLWGGCHSNTEYGSDYDSLQGSLSFSNDKLDLHPKDENLIYHIYFSPSGRVELFESKTGFVLCEGLYYNESINFSELEFQPTKNLDILINNHEGGLYVYDATFQGKEILEENKGSKGVFTVNQNSFNSYCNLKLTKGKYIARSVQSNIEIENEQIVLNGIELVLDNKIEKW
ncbi:hypothetical protein [Flagellimonas flava]|uniref:Uncharacterized protein n=1 Tax=Flagellimonas flava TaxID=570519 RepID=A0A1M5LMC9_9FLAO|nr:hypothetical protein [Allomuricauda flava]SHG66060.1 hypothetical protein SAMN04488116_1980 [Allomuricauda flava]